MPRKPSQMPEICSCRKIRNSFPPYIKNLRAFLFPQLSKEKVSKTSLLEGLKNFPRRRKNLGRKIGLCSGAPRSLKIWSENLYVKRRRGKKKREIQLFSLQNCLIFYRNSSYMAQIFFLLGFDPENLGSQSFFALFSPLNFSKCWKVWKYFLPYEGKTKLSLGNTDSECEGRFVFSFF